MHKLHLHSLFQIPKNHLTWIKTEPNNGYTDKRVLDYVFK